MVVLFFYPLLLEYYLVFGLSFSEKRTLRESIVERLTIFVRKMLVYVMQGEGYS